MMGCIAGIVSVVITANAAMGIAPIAAFAIC